MGECSHLGLRVQVKCSHPLCSFFFALASSVSQNKDQTPSWVNVCGGNYLFSEEKKSWDGAFGQCELYGAHLWKIDDIAENFCLLDYAHRMGYNRIYWHSANDQESEGVWRQADGTPLSWSPWWTAPQGMQGDPQGGKAENCAFVHLDDGAYAGQWSDITCNGEYYYVCERAF